MNVYLRWYVLKKIVLYGAGGFGREVATMIEVINYLNPTYELMGFLADGEQYHEGVVINGYPWLGAREWILKNRENVYCNCTIGDPFVKATIQKELTDKGVKFETIIAAGSFISGYTEIGKGCVIYGGATVSVNCKIGDGVLLNQGCNIGHDVTIGDYTVVMPGTGISGACQIGSQVSIGGHAFILPHKKVGDKAVVAAGSIVFSNVRESSTVIGNPAKRMKALE